jgi:hypothetical protein
MSTELKKCGAGGTLARWENAMSDYSKVIDLDPKFTAAYSACDIASNNLQSKQKQ